MAYKIGPLNKYLHAENQEPTASAMSGAMAGLAVLEETGKKRKAEELTELTTSDAGGADHPDIDPTWIPLNIRNIDV